MPPCNGPHLPDHILHSLLRIMNHYANTEGSATRKLERNNMIQPKQLQTDREGLVRLDRRRTDISMLFITNSAFV